MSKHLIVEERKKQKPTLLFVDTNSGYTNTLLNFLIEKLEADTKIFVLSQKKVSQSVDKISPLSVNFLDKLSGDLSYAVVFLDEEKQKKKVLQIISLLAGKKTKVVLLLPYRICEDFVDVLIQCKEIKNITVGLLGDTFGKSNPSSPLSKIIQNALTNHEIVIKGNELLTTYPISDTDVAIGISNLLFGRNTGSSFFYLFYDHPQTLISLAHLLGRVEQDLSITFEKDGINNSQEKTRDQIDRYLKDRIGISPHSFSNVFIGFEQSVAEMQDRSFQKIENPKKQKRMNFLHPKMLFFLKAVSVIKIIVVCLLLYIFIIGVIFFSGILFYKKGISELSSGGIENAEKSFQVSSAMYGLTRNTVFVFASFIPEVSNKQLRQNLLAYDDLMFITGDLLQGSKEIKKTNPSIGKKSFQELISLSMELYFLTQRYDTQAFKSVTQNDQYKTASRFLPLLSAAVSVLGYDSPKTYLILFQNNNELRPTGGFIGSVGQITLKNGSLSNVTLQDVYDLDGQLKGHVEPSYVVRRFLQPNQFLRDSNFAPDFEETASLSAFLYNLESGKRVDGVMSVDTNVLREVVNIVGPVIIPGYLKNITGQNVVDIMQDTIQNNNFPGSTQKKQLLQILLSKITLNLESDKGKQASVLKALVNLILQKHVLFSFPDNSIQKVFTAEGFAGSMKDLRISKNILPDFLSINEANIGVNKANEFVTRKVTYSAFLKPSVLASDALIEYSNTGQDDYKTYIRLILPKDAKLLSIAINGVEKKIVPAVTNPALYERKGFKPPAGFEVNQETQGGFSVYGFVASIPKGNKQRIHVLYENTNIVLQTGSFVYSLLYVKQPGTESYPLTVQLQGDSSYQIKNTNQNGGSVLFDENILTDKEITAGVVRTK